MEVLKIYAPDNLKEVLQKDAKVKGLSMSELTVDLLSISETFKNIHMVADGKHSSNRATVGKVFASKLGKGQ